MSSTPAARMPCCPRCAKRSSTPSGAARRPASRARCAEAACAPLARASMCTPGAAKRHGPKVSVPPPLSHTPSRVCPSAHLASRLLPRRPCLPPCAAQHLLPDVGGRSGLPHAGRLRHALGGLYPRQERQEHPPQVRPRRLPRRHHLVPHRIRHRLYASPTPTTRATRSPPLTSLARRLGPTPP